MYLFAVSDELSGGTGGIILIILLLIITAVVFAIKFALDIAVSKKLIPKYYDEGFEEHEQNYNSPGHLYAIKNDTPKKRYATNRTRNSGYTIIPQEKLFVLENPANKDRGY